MKKIGQLLLSSVLLVAFGVIPAQAETVVCTVIDSLPYTITTQGVYCLTGHLNTSMTSGNAITINTNNVVLDLNGFKIGGLSAGLGTTAIGIFAYQRQNITIKNGTVRGFLLGINLSDYYPYITSQGHLIEDIRADQNTIAGMVIVGKGNTIRNNMVVATGGSILYSSVFPYGMKIHGSGAQVLNNTVTEVVAKGYGEAYGIYLESSPNSVVAGNRISSLQKSGTGFRAGILLNASAGVVVSDNTVSNMIDNTDINKDDGIYATNSTDVIVMDNRLTGVQCGVWFDNSSGFYWGNLVRSVTERYHGGTAYVP